MSTRRRKRLRYLPGTAFLLCGLSLLAPGGVGAVPKPPPKFWSAGRCERVLHTDDYVIPTAQGHGFHVRQPICVGTGGPHACVWTSDRRSRLYSEFRVFGRARYIGSIVRSWTLATRGGHGLVPLGRRAGDAYAGWPAAFFVSPTSVRLLAASSTPERFRSVVAPIAAHLAQQENATGCEGGT